jgi:hypothetical protein
MNASDARTPNGVHADVRDTQAANTLYDVNYVQPAGSLYDVHYEPAGPLYDVGYTQPTDSLYNVGYTQPTDSLYDLGSIQAGDVGGQESNYGAGSVSSDAGSVAKHTDEDGKQSDDPEQFRRIVRWTELLSQSESSARDKSMSGWLDEFEHNVLVNSKTIIDQQHALRGRGLPKDDLSKLLLEGMAEDINHGSEIPIVPPDEIIKPVDVGGVAGGTHSV